MEYVELQGFEDFVEERNLVPQKYRAFYVRWIRRFLLSDSNLNGSLSEGDKVVCFLEGLTREAAVEEWQVQQAERAVKLYLNVYLPEANRDRPELDGSSRPAAVRGDRVKLDGAGRDCSCSSQSPAVRGDRVDAEMGLALAEMVKLLRLRHYAYRTEKTYVEWVERYLRYTGRQGLEWRESGSVRSFLSFLALQQEVASSTQNQALNALVFLFRETLGTDLEKLDAVRARRGRKLPTVLSVDEVRRLLDQVEGGQQLMLRLTYGGGLRVSETIRMRVQDLDFENHLLIVRSGKGDKDRTTLLPESLVEELKEQLGRVKALHDADLKKGFGAVYLPGSLDRKYPNAPREFMWQYVFPARNLSVDPRSGMTRRHHVSEKVMQSALKKAVRAAGIEKHVTVHTLRHSFATHLLMSGTNIREVQDLLGHQSLETTMIYTHVVKEMSAKPQSPLDAL